MPYQSLKSHQQTIADFLCGRKSLNSNLDDQLLIYAQNYRATLTNALQLTYPRVKILLGNDFFNQIAARFIELFPSRQSYLQSYGAEFPHYLKSHTALQNYGYVAEIARFEWLGQMLVEDAYHFENFNYPVLEILDFCERPQKTLLNLMQVPCRLQLHKKHNQLFCKLITD